MGNAHPPADAERSHTAKRMEGGFVVESVPRNCNENLHTIGDNLPVAGNEYIAKLVCMSN